MPTYMHGASNSEWLDSVGEKKYNIFHIIQLEPMKPVTKLII